LVDSFGVFPSAVAKLKRRRFNKHFIFQETFESLEVGVCDRKRTENIVNHVSLPQMTAEYIASFAAVVVASRLGLQ